jgi:hypothetical protein
MPEKIENLSIFLLVGRHSIFTFHLLAIKYSMEQFSWEEIEIREMFCERFHKKEGKKRMGFSGAKELFYGHIEIFLAFYCPPSLMKPRIAIAGKNFSSPFSSSLLTYQ